MDKALLDTDMLSEVLKRADPTVVARATAYHTTFGRYTVSLLSVFEIVKGFQQRQLERRIQQFLARLTAMELLTLDLPTAELAGRIQGNLDRTGQTIGRVDPLIAATALHHNLVLVTGNQNHYLRLQSLGYALRLDNWRV